MHRRDMVRLRKAFHPDAFLFGHFHGVFKHLALDLWLTKIAAQPLPAEIGEVFDMHIVSMDVTGEMAAVKVVDFYHGLQFTDVLTMVKIDNRWLIVNRVFHHD